MLNHRRSIRILAGIVFATAAAWSSAQTTATQSSTPSAGMKAPPQFPASNTVLQAALSDYSHCIDNAIAASADAQSTTTADAVAAQCAAPQAQLKQMLPADAYDKGMTNTRQRVTSVLAAQKAAPASP